MAASIWLPFSFYVDVGALFGRTQLPVKRGRAPESALLLSLWLILSFPAPTTLLFGQFPSGIRPSRRHHEPRDGMG